MRGQESPILLDKGWKIIFALIPTTSTVLPLGGSKYRIKMFSWFSILFDPSSTWLSSLPNSWLQNCDIMEKPITIDIKRVQVWWIVFIISYLVIKSSIAWFPIGNFLFHVYEEDDWRVITLTSKGLKKHEEILINVSFYSGLLGKYQKVCR